MNRELSAAEAALIVMLGAAWYAGMVVFRHDLPSVLLAFALVVAIEPLLVLAHELGHAAMAVRVTNRPVRVHAGEPPYAWRFSIGRVRIEYAWRGIIGHCDFERSVPISGSGLLLIAIAGPAVNALIALLAGGLAFAYRDTDSILLWSLFLTALSSTFLALGNLIPHGNLPRWWPGAIESDHEMSDGFVALLAIKAGLRSTVLTPPPRTLYAESARQALVAAAAAARADRTDDVGTDHLLHGLFCVRDSAAARILRDCGYRPPARETDGAPTDPKLTPAARSAVERAKTVLTLRGDQLIDTEHVLLGLVEEPHSRAADVLAEAGIDRSELRRRLLRALAS